MNNRHFNINNATMSRVVGILILAGLVASCGGNSDKKNTAPGIVAEEKSTPAPATGESIGVAEVVINGNDQMRFDTDEIRVRAGATVALTLNHTGTLPKAAMGHNVVILGSGVDVATFASAAVKAKDNDYIPEGFEIIAHTKMLGGGESTSITFEAPPVGSYDFICSFPGHYAVMRGKFIVE